MLTQTISNIINWGGGGGGGWGGGWGYLGPAENGKKLYPNS